MQRQAIQHLYINLLSSKIGGKAYQILRHKIVVLFVNERPELAWTVYK
jgi:hypothetical protein